MISTEEAYAVILILPAPSMLKIAPAGEGIKP